MAQVFVGKRTLVTDVYPLKSQKQFVNTLEDNIRFRGAMTKLISDYAKVEISNKVKDILRGFLAIKKVRTPCTPRAPHAFDVCPPMRFTTLWTAWCVVSTHHVLH